MPSWLRAHPADRRAATTETSIPLHEIGCRVATICAFAALIGLVNGCASIKPWEDSNAFTVSAEPLAITPETLMHAVLQGPVSADALARVIYSVDDFQKQSYLGAVLADSKQKCATFLNRMSVAQNGVNTVGDVTTTILSGVAAVVTPLGASHALSAASTIVGGTKSAIDQDLWANAGIQDFQKALQTSYYSAADTYQVQLESMRNINIAMELPKIQSIHDLCTLAAAKNVINSTLSNPNQGPTQNPTGGTRGVVPGQGIGAYTGPTGKSPVTPTPTPTEAQRVTGAINAEERKLFAWEGRRIQAALCTAAGRNQVTFGPQTRAAIELFRGTGTGSNIGPKGPNGTREGLNSKEISVLETTPACPTACYRNAFEYFEYGPSAGMGSDASARPEIRAQILKSLHLVMVTAAKESDGKETITDFCESSTKSLIGNALTQIGLARETPLTDAIVRQLKLAKLNEPTGPAAPTTAPQPLTMPK